MNPRVKELAEEAGGVVLAGSEIEKFAELIVRECADIADSIGEHGYIASEEMLEQFGVK